MKTLIYFVLFFNLLPRLDAQIHVGKGQIYSSIYQVCRAKAAHPGDTIYLHAGIYTDRGQVFDSLIGSPSKWIYIRPWLQDSISIQVAYTFQHAQFLHLSGLNFFGNNPSQSTYLFHMLYFDYDYACFTANHHIIVDHCKFQNLNNSGKANTGAMLKFTGTDYFEVSNCLFKDGINITDGISLNGNRNGRIFNCRFENMPGDGSHCKGGTKNITYEQNLFVNCEAAGLDIGGDTGLPYFCPLGAAWEADSIHVFSNIFIGGKTGIKLSSCHNSRIFNNTCFKSTAFAFRSLNASSHPIYLLNNHVYNNIFSTYSSYPIYLNATAGFAYQTAYFYNNLFHSYKSINPKTLNWSEMPGVNISGNLIADPLFRDTTLRDFSLMKGSLAIGSAYATKSPERDYFGKLFVSLRSIGAIEYYSSSSLPEVNNSEAISIFPNPTSGEFSIQWSSVLSIKQIEIYNLLGQTILVFSPDPNTFQMNIDLPEAGVYQLILKSESGLLKSKMMICK